MKKETSEQLDSQVEMQMYLHAYSTWSIPHDPLGGTYRHYHVGGGLPEDTVIALYNGTSIKLTKDYVRGLFTRLEASGKGIIEKFETTWIFTFNQHRGIYSTIDDLKSQARKPRRRSRRNRL